MAKKLTSAKAKEILHDKSVHGHPLTEKQRKFFGAIAGGAKPYKAEDGGWLDKYEQGGLVLKQKTHDNYGKKPNANESNVTLPPGFKGWAYNTKGRNYSPAWGGQFQNGGKKEKLKPIKQVYSDNTYVKSKPYIGLDDVYDARISDEKTAKTFLNQYYDWATNNHPFYRDLTGLDSFNVQRDYMKKNKAEVDRLNKEVFSDLPVDIINKKYDTLFYRQGDGEFIGDPSLKTLYKKEMANAYQDFRRKPVSSLNAPDTLVFHRGYVRGDEGLLGQHDPLKNITDVSDLDRLQTLVHERAHKADASKRMKGVANESLDNFVKLKNYDISDDAYLDSDRLEYLRHFSERQARHRSTQFWLNKNMPGYDFKKPITEKEYDFLIKNQSKIPSDVKDLLRLYGDKENFIKYSNRFEMGGSLPGATGMMYARTQSPAPSNGPYAKKTKASAQNGQEMKYYQAGLDFKPKTISQDGSDIPVDPMGYWNPENVGSPVIIPSNVITMEGVDQPLLGISDTGDVQYMEPGEDYEFDGEYVTEYPMAKGGVSVNNADAQPIKKLDQLLNFTNYNKPTKGGWLDKYQ
jgi:hypothetical protein